MPNHEPVRRAAAGRQTPLERGLPAWAMILVGLVALASLVTEHGFALDAGAIGWLERIDIAVAALFGVDLLVVLARSEQRGLLLRRRWFEFALLALLLLSITALSEFGDRLGARSVAKLYLVAVQVFLLGVVLARVLRSQERLLERRLRPELVLVVSFVLLTLLGTGLLSLPRARAAGSAPIELIDALFTATSAACVTGLVVRDTGAELSGLGQWVVLGLFQAGGLGIVTFVAAGQIFSARRMSVPQQVLLKEVLSARNLSDVRRHVRDVVLLVLGVELVGAAALFVTAELDGGLGSRAFWSLFHSVSAFCNAGFALHADSLEGFRGAWGVNLVVIALIVVGGLGLPSLRDLGTWLRAGGPRRLLRRPPKRVAPPPRLMVQTRLSLAATAALLALGILGVLALEWGHALAGLPLDERLLAGLFQGVTPRTAGFNTVPMGELRAATRVLVIGLMIVGAGPISTGGGVKTVTVAVLLFSLRAMVAGRDEVEVGGRSLPTRVVRAALFVFVSYLVTAGLLVFLLTLFEPGLAPEDLAFEAVSALSTVGLSTGVTAQLGAASKLALCAAMLVGRVGPLAVALAIFSARGATVRYRFPEEDLIVG